MSNAPLDPRPEDLDDYAVECEEHLSTARRRLLDLESVENFSAINRESLDALFRAFHTIKGLSGMVGARIPEDAAHVSESYMAAIRDRRAALTKAGVDALLDALGLIERAVDAFLRGEPAPSAAQLVARVESLFATAGENVAPTALPPAGRDVEGEQGALAPEKQRRLESAVQRGERAWSVLFTPSAELAERGVNVGAIRSRLAAIGDILNAEPIPTPGGVRFRFVVTTSASFDPSTLAVEGVAFKRYEAVSDAQKTTAVGPSSAAATTSYVRVDLRRLDDVMRTVGDLVLSRARLEDGVGKVARRLAVSERRDLEATTEAIERQLRDLRDQVLRVRMVPIGDLFERMRLVVREAAREQGKDVELVLSGVDTEIDKFVVERLADPVLHLVRNAVSHGIEAPRERTASAKPSKGRVTLRASSGGGTAVLEIEDDGRGVQTDEVFARARRLGLATADALADSATVLDLLCAPGFSTRDTADRASGRGVGLDVVRTAIEDLGGTLALESRPGQGCRFTARMPLTLSIAEVVTVAVGGRTYALPRTAVREVVPVEPNETTLLERNELIRFRGRAVPLVRIGDVFGAPRPAGAFVALVVGDGAETVALAADRAIGLREVVVRALADPLIQAPGLAGATELGDGRPILILDAVSLTRLARRRPSAPTAPVGGTR